MKHAVALISLVILCVIVAATSSAALDYSSAGPFGFTRQRFTFELPAATGCKKCSLQVLLHVPVPLPNAPRGAPYPVVAVFNAFQLRAAFYAPYAERLASWGYGVLQYDLPALTLVDDATELRYLPALVATLQQRPPLAALLDFSRLGVVGHSRGGKLAALSLAGLSPGLPPLVTAVLVDPVDNTAFSPEGPRYPSAVRALSGQNKTAALIGAGVRGPCNPLGSGWERFWGVLGRGSWLEGVWGAGHVEFAHVEPAPLRWALDKVCGAGANTTYQEVIQLTVTPMVAWVDTAFKQQQRQLAAPSAARPSSLATGGPCVKPLAAAAEAATAARQPLQQQKQQPPHTQLVQGSTATASGTGCVHPAGSGGLLLPAWIVAAPGLRKQPAGNALWHRSTAAGKPAATTIPRSSSSSSSVGSVQGPLQDFFAWVAQQEERGLVDFLVKGAA